jgi:hypothetical protein
MKRLFLLFLLTHCLSTQAQTNTDIYLLDLSMSAGRLTLSNPKNIMNKAGYDNQPFFHPSQPILYYVSMMADKQTEVWSYNLKTEAHTQLTHTPDSEFSPTVIPGTTHLSCIVQRAATGDQDLVKYDLTKPANSTLILASQQTGKIGYQAWMSANELITFILGTPATLHYMNLAQGKDTLLVADIGRSLHRIPKQQAFSFVQKQGDKWLIRSYSPALNRLTDIAESQPGSTHYTAWTSDGVLLESRNNEIWRYNTRSKQWQPVQLPKGLPSKPISRLAVQGNKVAIVLDE